MATFRARVGVQRVHGSLDPAQASYTRSIREQMREIERNYTKFVNSTTSATPRILEEALKPTFMKSQKYTPLDTGALRASGYLEVRKVGDKVRAEIGYGKGGKPYYAVFVHEMLHLAHKAPTRAKFLQSALEEDANAIVARIRKAYRRLVGNS